ncbi:MAG: GAF domain-containing protein [Anaerolineales bacterium]|nr:GAF domain-containing protein [Anaerolineales bacterium]
MTQAEQLQSALEVLGQLSEAINASFSEAEVLSSILEHIVRDLGYKAATLRLLDEEKQVLGLKAAFGVSGDYLAKGDVAPSQSGVDQEALQGRRVAVDDVRSDARFQYGQAAAREGLAGQLVVPLSVYRRVIGVLHVYTAEPHTFQPLEEALLAVVGNLAAQAIQRARIFTAFRRIAQQVNSSLELKKVLAALVLEAAAALGVGAASLRLLGPGRRTLHMAATYGLSKSYLEKGPVEVAQSPVDQRVLTEAQPVAISELTPTAGWQYFEAAQREGIRSVLVVPLRVFNTSVGVLRLYSSQVRRYSPEEIGFAVAVAELGAVAIQNAKLHETVQQRVEALKQDADGWYRFLALS